MPGKIYVEILSRLIPVVNIFIDSWIRESIKYNIHILAAYFWLIVASQYISWQGLIAILHTSYVSILHHSLIVTGHAVERGALLESQINH